MKYSESQADREIDKISDHYAFNRYTIKEAMDDDDMAYLFECFFKHEVDLETGKTSHKALPRKTANTVQSRDFKAKLRSSVYCGEPSC